jgi:uncharacterized cupin superfamily protein
VRGVVPEAPLERTEHGTRPAGEGWFVLNVRDACWFENEMFGKYGVFESEQARFHQVGIGIGVLHPGQPNGMYHGEDAQEDFLVVSGECLLIVEGEERRLKAWDFVHCPPWTEHIFVGSGDGPCVVIGVGARRKGRGIRYPVNATALAHGAGVETETTVPAEAYATLPDDRPIRCPDDVASG